MSPLRSPRARLLGAASLVLGSATALFALNDKNAGPETFEIKFKLPPPAPLSAQEELATFKLPPGFHAELVAAEPMVDSPIAMSWDEKGRLFVCEMRPYMHDVEGLGEDQPTGRIVMLESTKGDGTYDKRTVFADGLIMPRAVMCVNGGILVGEPPNLWFLKDTKGTGKADVKELVDAHFGTRNGQPEHMVNSPTWMLDNWIYCANHASRYKLKDGKFVAERAASRGQWGLSQDDYGHRYYNFNSDFLRASFVPEELYFRNPNFTATAGAGVQIMKDQHCWPSHPTPGVNRGYEKLQLRDDGTLATCTATCGAGIYRAALFGKEYLGDAFIPEPAGNLVKRLKVAEKDAELTASNAYPDGQEFMTSTDERFRPVNAYTGPDGALYIVDMYRGVIQHKGFLTHYLIANIKDRKLEEPFSQGRLWRIVPDGKKVATVKLPQASVELVKSLSDSNGWVRDTAQRLLVERKDASVAPALGKLAASGSTLARLHALWTLEGMGALTPEVVTAALQDKEAKVRATAVCVADRTMAAALAKLVQDPSLEVRSALGFTLSTFPETQDAAYELARTSGREPLVREPLLSGLRGRELEALAALATGKQATAPEMLGALAQAVMAEHRTARVQKMVETAAALPANSPALHAILSGAAGKAPAKGAPKARLIYLEAEPKALAAMSGTADEKTKALITALDERLAWPNKPGVPPPPVIKPLTATEQQLYDGGKTVYETLCAACHQPTGTGMPGLAPALVDSNWVLGNPEALPRIVINGLSGPLKVNGETWNLEMPPLGPALTDEQIAGVLTYIRREWEHGASPVPVAKVAAIRAQYKDRTKAWEGEELAEAIAPTKKKEPVQEVKNAKAAADEKK